MYLRYLYIAEDTAEWITASLASIKPNHLDRLIFFYCTYDMEDMTTPGAAALALSTVDQAIVELKDSKGSNLRRVELFETTIKGEEERLAQHDWAIRCFPKTLQAGLLGLEMESRRPTVDCDSCIG